MYNINMLKHLHMPSQNKNKQSLSVKARMAIVTPIKNDKQYEGTLESIYELIKHDVKPGSELGDKLEVLTILVKAYEEKRHPIPKPHPLEAIRFRLDQLGLSESELSKILGTRSRKSEIFSGKRKLSLQMIRKLHEQLNIPAEVLIQPY